MPALSCGDVAYLERGSRVYRCEATHAVEIAAPLPGRIVGADHDSIVCLADDTQLVHVDVRSGDHQHLFVLDPRPAVVAVTPDWVVWAAGRELWRWWRGSDHAEWIESLADDEPMLAVIPPRVPLDPARVSSDVLVAHGGWLGIVGAAGLGPLSRAAVEHVACTAATACLAHSREVIAIDFATSAKRRLYRDHHRSIVELAAAGDHLAVMVATGHVLAIDLATGATAPLREHALELAATTDGVYSLDDDGIHFDGWPR